jgi:Mn-dependent DtxR family transcriptional regulator
MSGPFHRSVTKKELAEILNVSPSTLQKYLNERYLHRLESIGYDKNSRILMPKVLNEIAEILDIEDTH